MIELTTLGTVELRSKDGEEFRSVLAQRKRLALLTYLVMARPRAFHRRDSLLPIFWPEMTEPRARHALRQSLHFLRQALGPDIIVTRGGEEVGVAQGAFQCDAVLFEAHVSAGNWEEAVHLYNGPMLKGVNVSHSPDFDRWLDAERGRLSDLYVKALDGLLESKNASPARTVQWLRRRAEHDAYDAGITLRLMRALEAVHDRPGALHQARAYRELVEGDLGLEPDPRITALAERLANDAHPAPHTERQTQQVNVSPADPAPMKHLGRWIGAAAVLLILTFALIQNFRVSGRDVASVDAVARTTVIVAPFTNLSDSAGLYLADGIAEGVLNRLSGLSALRVIGWVKDESSVMARWADRGSPFPDALVLRASVQRDCLDGDSIVVRVVASVTRSDDDVVIWRATYDRGFFDLPMIERDIAMGFITGLGVTTLVAERAFVRTLPTEDARAYDEYLKGMAALDRNGWIGREWTAFGPRVDFPRAVRHFEAAGAFDSSFVLPLARLTIAHTSMYHWRYDRTRTRLQKAKAAMDRSIQMRPDLQSTHLAAAWYHYLGQLDYNRALRHLQMAGSAWAGKAEAMFLTGAIRRRQGEIRQAIDQYRAAEREAGICPDCRAEMAYSYYVLGDVTRAEEAIDSALSLAPQLHLPRHISALIRLTEFGDAEGANDILHPVMLDTDNVMHLSSSRWSALVRILGGEWELALDRLTLDRVSGDTTSFLLAKADLAERNGQPQLARSYYDSARLSIESILDDVGGNAFAHSELGLAYAGLGRKADAIREGTVAVRLRPPTFDMLDGPVFVEALANIYMKVGELDAAVRQLEDVLDQPAWLSPALIRLDPRWAPLREHPGFRRLVAEERAT